MTSELVRALISQGDRFYEQGDYPRALTIASPGAKHGGTDSVTRLGIARAQNNIGNVHRSQGDYAQASEYFQKSLALSEALDDRMASPARYETSGISSTRRATTRRRWNTFRRRLELSEKLGDKAGIARLLAASENVHGHKATTRRRWSTSGRAWR